MHIALLISDGFSPTEISRVLYCSRTTVYALARRLVAGGGFTDGAVFDDCGRGGPKPLLKEPTEEYMGRLVEDELPTEHGWLRSPASLELQAVGRGAVQGTDGRGKPGDGPPCAPPPRLPLEEAASGPARERLR